MPIAKDRFPTDSKMYVERRPPRKPIDCRADMRSGPRPRKEEMYDDRVGCRVRDCLARLPTVFSLLFVYSFFILFAFGHLFFLVYQMTQLPEAREPRRMTRTPVCSSNKNASEYL